MRKVFLSHRSEGINMRKRIRNGVAGVEITDWEKKLEYFVTVIERDGLPELTRHDVQTTDGRPLEVPPHDDYLPHAWLASAALDFLRDGSLPGSRVRLGTPEGVQIAIGGNRPRTHIGADRQPRPDDERLIRFLETAHRQQQRQPAGEAKISLREALVEKFGITKSTADGWIRRARDLAPDRIPKNTGRPRKTETSKEES